MEVNSPRIHRNAESTSWAIYGTTCERIRDWVNRFMTAAPRWSCYLDAEHQEQTIGFNNITMGSGYHTSMMNGASPSPYKVHWINGNHFAGPRQIVIHDEAKIASLQRRKDQLTRLDLVISNDGFPSHLMEWGKVDEHTMCLHPDDEEGWVKWIHKQLKPLPLAALILTGGKSSRMGEDKAFLNYHGLPQWAYVKQQCEAAGLPVWISCRADQEAHWKGHHPKLILDQWNDWGPIGGILSAMRQEPHRSWIVMACDMPNWNAQAIQHLIQHRNTKAGATAFWNADRQWHEPLAAIWEADLEGRLMQWAFVSRCPRKFLHQFPTQSVDLKDNRWVENINDQEQRNNWIKPQGE
jgi:molybdopterin-guanine dinucleotide biosynthesis protein A